MLQKPPTTSRKRIANVRRSYAQWTYLIAGENDVLNLGDVEFGHAGEDVRQFDEAIERENDDEQVTKGLHLIR